MQSTELSIYIQHFSYLGIFLWFLIIEQFTPVPEEVSLISLGYLCIHNHLNLFLAGSISLAGLLLTDNMLFYISQKSERYSANLIENFNISLLSKLKQNLKTHSIRTLIFCALIPKIRFISPIIAANSGISGKQFFVVNGLTTLTYVWFYVLSGVLVHTGLGKLQFSMQNAQHIVFASLIILLSIAVILRLRKYLPKSSNSGL